MRFFELINEGVNDPAIFKTVFIVGGPGSGKTYISKQLGLNALGYVTINSDLAFEYLMKKNNLNSKMPDDETQEREIVRKRAKDITANKSALAIDGRLGLFIDATGAKFQRVNDLKTKFEELGYDCYLIIVNTQLDIAMNRNKNRERTVPDDVVIDSWNSVQNNIGMFAKIFNNVSIIDNNGDDGVTNDQINNTYKKILSFTKMPPNKPIARQWIQKQHMS